MGGSLHTQLTERQFWGVLTERDGVQRDTIGTRRGDSGEAKELPEENMYRKLFIQEGRME